MGFLQLRGWRAQELRSLLPHAEFQGKGIWATEGVVNIPYQDTKALAVTSHFFEFRDLQTDEIFSAWNLKTGQNVQPVLTTGAGFFRYALEYRLVVGQPLEGCPTFEFAGRLQGVDLVGEKMDPAAAQEILRKISREFQVHAMSFIADAGNSSKKAGYTLLLESARTLGPRETGDISKRTEELCSEFHHYKLARQLGQLRGVDVFATRTGLQCYMKLNRLSGLIGGAKIEPLLQAENLALENARSENSEGYFHGDSARATTESSSTIGMSPA